MPVGSAYLWRPMRKGVLHMGILDELLAGGQRQKEYNDFLDCQASCTRAFSIDRVAWVPLAARAET